MKVQKLRIAAQEHLWKGEMTEFFERAEEAGLLVGHSDGMTLAGHTGPQLATGFKGNHLWLHACLSVNLAREIATHGQNAYGFTTRILCIRDEEVQHAREALKSSPASANAPDVIRDVQGRWHSAAVAAIQSGRVLQAAILTHLELTVRGFPPGQ